jgi:hypothetical protein
LKCFSQRNKHKKKPRIIVGDIVGFVGFGELRFALLQKGLVAPKWIEKKWKFEFVKTLKGTIVKIQNLKNNIGIHK